MNKKVLLGLFLGSSVLFLIIATYLWYHFFAFSQNKSIILNSSGDNIIVSGSNTFDKPIKYYMEVNNYNKNNNYSLYLVDNNSDKNILDKNNINYQLILNGSVIKEDKLVNINDILDKRFINSNVSNNYELILWVDPNNSSLSYNFQIKLATIE